MRRPNLGVVFFPAFDWMIDEQHPERQERLLYTRDQLLEEGLFDLPEIREYRPQLADWRAIERVHAGAPDLRAYVTDAHRVSAGGAMTAGKLVLEKLTRRSFALVRPPGHHAMRIVHGIRGFCTINIEAVMIEELRQKYGVRRVAVVDTDVHHGDGTQDIFYHDPDTLFISLHQDGRTLYPGSGFPEEAGSPAAWGTTINLPLLPGTGDRGVLTLTEELIKPILDEFAPDIIINSAGQDNHFTDPLAAMAVTAQGYAQLAARLQADIAVLEGGYSIEAALPYVNTGIVLSMAGLDYSQVQEPTPMTRPADSEKNMARVRDLIAYWREAWASRAIRQREGVRQAQGVWRRKKQIYYDAEGIHEEQQEIIRYCPRCSGYQVIESVAWHPGRGKQSLVALFVRRDACLFCLQAARDEAARYARSKEWQQVVLENGRDDCREA